MKDSTHLSMCILVLMLLFFKKNKPPRLIDEDQYLIDCASDGCLHHWAILCLDLIIVNNCLFTFPSHP